MIEKVKDWVSVLKKKVEPVTNWVNNHLKLSIFVASALLPMLIMLLVWIFMGMYPFGSKSLMAVDFSHQYVSFFAFLKETILSGKWSAFFYSFTKSLGGDMIGVLAYYLMSPFNIIYIVTPLSHFPLAIFLTIWLRYGAIGLSFAYLLIKRYKAMDFKPWLIPVFATAYALSGMLVSYQMNPIFYDAMIMLPLVIVALEELLDGGKPYRYMVTLGLTMLLQFYMGYMICLFVALYACFYLSPRLEIVGTWKEKIWHFLQPLLKALSFSIVGVGLSAALLYPVVLNLMQSKGQIGSGMGFSFAFQINPLDILSKLMIGGFDTTSGWSAGPNLPNIYVGALALVGFILYFKFAKAHRYQKIGAGVITGIFFISFVNEFTSKIWHMGQNPAGFFFRFSWILSFFMVLLAFQAFKQNPKISRKGLLIGLACLVFSGIYVASQDYTYIAKAQPEVITDYVNGHLTAIYAFLVIFLGAISYFVWKKWEQAKKIKMIFTGTLLLFAPLSVFLLQKGYLLTQLSLTLLTWAIVLALFAFRPQKLGWSILAIMTIFEMGYNAYLSQVTLVYADAYKFSDATVSVKRVTDAIQDSSDATFYRIAGTFAYSKTSPSLLSYPGLTSFSSSLERSTVDLFSYLGDYGINASTQYANGTLVTDALYGVRYFMDIKDYDQSEVTANPEKMYFSRKTSRKDIEETFTEKVYEDSRYLVYENPDAFSVAFGTNTLLQNITFGQNNPVSNQNLILNTMAGEKENTVSYFQGYSFSAIETENLEETVNDNGETIYKRIDSDKAGILRYKAIPRSNFTYYFLTPSLLKTYRGKVSILLDNKWIPNTVVYSQKQLWQLTSNASEQEVTLEFRFSTDEDINMNGAGFIRADNAAIKKVLAERKEQNMTVTEWTNTKVAGTVNITDDSNVMMTSIPYSKGWTVKVDGKKVATKKAWDSLLSFPITSGQHTIEMTFAPAGLFTGIVFSLISLASILTMYWSDKKSDLT